MRIFVICQRLQGYADACDLERSGVVFSIWLGVMLVEDVWNPRDSTGHSEFDEDVDELILRHPLDSRELLGSIPRKKKRLQLFG